MAYCRDVDPEPQIRASWTKLTLGTLKREPPEASRPVLDALADERAQLRELGITAWARVELHLAVGEAMEELLGPSRARKVHRQVLLRALDSVLLKPIAKGSVRLHGPSPAAMLRRAPGVHRLISRECGKLEVTRIEEGAVDVVLTDLPVVLRTRRSFLVSYEATCEAILENLGISGTVRRHDPMLASIGESRIEVRWSPARDT